MKRLLLIASLACLATVLLNACSSSTEQQTTATGEQERQPRPSTTPETTPAAPGEPAGLSMTGELKEVDLQAKTLVLRDANMIDHTFNFSDSTAISDGSGAQGLSGQQGNRATIWYAKAGDVNQAVRIEVTPK